MKKIKILLFVTALTSLFITGCSKNEDGQKTLEKKIDQLEQDIEDLQAKDITPKSEEDTVTADSSNEVKDISDLTSAVESFKEKIDQAAPTGTAAEQEDQFFTLKSELNSIEKDLDTYEDNLESQYKNGTLSYENYKIKERELNSLEEKIDTADDRLDVLFGLND